MGDNMKMMNKYRSFIKRKIKLLLFHLSKNKDFREYRHIPFNHNKPLPKNAFKTMVSCCEALESLGLTYRLTDGTALGLYRQGDFIPHDNDIDIDVLDYINVDLINNKMKLESMHLGREVIFKKKVQQLVYYNDDEVIFDIVFWHSKDSKIFNYSERGYERCQEKRFFNDLSEFDYRGRKYPMPSNIEEWLEMRFGPDWKIPKTYKDDWKKECGDIRTIEKEQNV